MSTQVKTEEVYIANRKLKYGQNPDGSNRIYERGEIIELIGGPYDLQMISKGYVHAVDKRVYEQQQALRSKAQVKIQPEPVTYTSPLAPPVYELPAPIMNKLTNAGVTLEDALFLADEDLLAIDGIGPAALKTIREAQK
jgi:hypothetical protein